MISDQKLPELKRYRALEDELPVEAAGNFASLVVPGQNECQPVHRWFRFKEGYSASLLSRLLVEHVGELPAHARLLDPFAGSGTTLLSAQMFARPEFEAVGIERNPFIRFVAQTKLNWHKVNPETFSTLAEEVLKKSSGKLGELPELSSISTGRCVSKHVAGRLSAIRDAVLAVNQPYRDLLLLGLAASIEPLSKVRKDGRALRIVERERQVVKGFVLNKWRQFANDIKILKPGFGNVASPKLFLGDGRNLSQFNLKCNSFDLILTSPPYPNNIDYSEVYKLELWMLGFVTNPAAFLKLRKSTFRSHQSSDLELNGDVASLLERPGISEYLDPLLKRTGAYPEKWRNRLVLGYFSDLFRAVAQQYSVLKPGGKAFLVVGNSLHGDSENAFLIPTDLILASIATSVGFELQSVLIARNMKRRLSGNHFLRESIVVLRKPANG